MRSSTVLLTYTHVFPDIPDEEFDFVIKGRYHPSTPDVWYLSNGDPGYPGDPEELELLEVSISADLSDEAAAHLVEKFENEYEEGKTSLLENLLELAHDNSN